MIRYLRYLCIALLAISLLTVALANRAPVTVRALPEDLSALLGFGGQLELPLFLVIFAGIAAGLLIGFIWEWFREGKYRIAASRKTREASRLEQELAVLRDDTAQPRDEVLALLEKPRKAV